MKKKLLILSAAIGLVLACFPFTLCAEEDPESNLGVSAPPAYYQLDDYFYDNYTLLPYVESDGSQYIDTGIKANDNLLIDIDFSLKEATGTKGLFGSRVASNSSALCVTYQYSPGQYIFAFQNSSNSYQMAYSDYQIYNIKFDENKVYMNNNLIYTFTDSTFSNNYNIYMFSLNNAGSPLVMSSAKVYKMAIYDYVEDEYVRYLYPARAKSGGTIGFYDAVSKTFLTTGGSIPFSNPTGSDAEMSITAKVTTFILSSLGWIGDILDYAISEPVIILFMAIGLAGAMFRWSRRLVHF